MITKKSISCSSENKKSIYKQQYRILFAYDSSSSESHRRLLKVLLPDITNSHLSKLFNLRLKNECACFETSSHEVQILIDNIDASHLGGSVVQDPTCGSRTIQEVFQENFRNIKSFESYDINMYCFPDVVVDALNPREQIGIPRPDYVVFSPPWEQSDAFVFYGAKRAKKAVMALVAGDFLTNAPNFRAKAWNKYAEEGKTHVIAGLPLVRGRPARRAIWVIIAKTAAGLKQLLKAGVQPCHLRLENV